MQSNQTTAPRSPKGYNPSPIRRCVRREFTTPEIAGGITKSFTREGVEHHPAVDLVTGECRCTCEHFHYRLQPQVKNLDINAVSLSTPMLWCKHLQRFVEGCVRRGEVAFDAATKTYSLAHPTPQPVNAVEVPAHVNPETGEVKPGYLPNGQVDYAWLCGD